MTKKIELTDLEFGDIVLVKAKWEDDGDGGVLSWVKPIDIHSILESPLRVGDNVIWNNESCPGTIKAIVDDEAWVEWDNHNGKQIIFLKLLKKIP